MSDVEGDVPSAAPVEAAGPMGINEAIQEVLKQVRARTILIIHSTHKVNTLSLSIALPLLHVTLSTVPVPCVESNI